MEITLVAMGMGDGATLTAEASEALRAADGLIGAARLFSALPEGCTDERFEHISADDIVAEIGRHPGWRRACVLYSGDTGFYSGAALLQKRLSGHAVRTLCGVSSVQYFAAQIGRSWKDFTLASAHGRDCDVVTLALNHTAVFLLTGSDSGPAALCARLRDAGMGTARVTVGERLSYPDQRITTGSAEELAEKNFAPLSVMLVEYARRALWPYASPGLPDSLFTRGDAPMTKQEVRAVALAKLRVGASDVLYDVGAGTGSVSVEMALLARYGQVYAVENNPAAFELMQVNRKEFGVYNLLPVQGTAPEALQGLPAPDAVFIGGSKGKLDEIIEVLVKKNSAVRIVIAAVTLETLAAASAALERFGVSGVETVQISISRGERIGTHTLLKGQNPIFLVSGGGQDG